MPIRPGTYTLGPDEATLTVRTRRAGAAAKAGHDLDIEVASWNATLDLGDAPGEAAIALTADGRSLRVREGTGGMQELGDEEKASVEQTIDDEVLRGGTIEFHSTSVRVGTDGGLSVEGDLDLVGARHPIAFELSVGEEGRLTGSARLRQTDWGMKPYSALFGTLKVADEVEVVIDARLPLRE
jgi:polyisoprenoid-binding protein YceI